MSSGHFSRLLFLAESLEARRLLWGTIELVPDGAFPQQMYELDGTVFFTADDGVHGTELWRTDGTAEGTALVKDIRPGPDSAFIDGASNPFDPSFATLNGKLCFYAEDGVTGIELWMSDGTEAGTTLVKDIHRPNTDIYAPSPGSLVVLGGTLYFPAADSTHGMELWKSDGTSEGTVLVRDLWTGPDSSEPMQLTDFNGELFFGARDEIGRVRLWKSDGTSTGTVIVKDIQLAPYGVPTNTPLSVGGMLMFSAFDSDHGVELWKSDGTPDGTVLVKDIYPGRDVGWDEWGETWHDEPNNSWPRRFTDVDGTIFFSARNGENDNALWKTDGTTAGTVLVKDVYPNEDNYGEYSPKDLVNVNGTLYFTADDGSGEEKQWTSDGTEGGTVVVTDFYAKPQQLVDANGMLYFPGDFDGKGWELWKRTGAWKSVLVKDILPGADSSDPGAFISLNGAVIFSAQSGTGDVELWTSDGTAQGTVLLKEINPNRVLRIKADNWGEAYNIRVERAGEQLLVNINGIKATYALADVDAIEVEGGEQADRIDLSGVPVPCRIDAWSGENTIFGGDGSDWIRAAGILHGGGGGDTIQGAETDDQLFGEDGDDSLYGWAGNDTIYGGSGDDTVEGMWGDDKLYGEDGADMIGGFEISDHLVEAWIYEDVGHDSLYGGGGADRMFGGGGGDLLSGGGGKDKLWGAGGRDRLYAGKANDTLDGGSGHDRLFGHAGNDVLYGGSGNDILDCGGGVDFLCGNKGDDTISGVDAVNDTVDGGRGVDSGQFDDLLDSLTSIESILS